MVAVVEMGYFRTLEAVTGNTVTRVLGVTVDTASVAAWAVALGLLAAAAVAFEAVRRRFARQWDAVQLAIEQRTAAGGVR